MPVTRCPHCAVALLEEEAAGTHCPACGGELRDAADPHPAPAVPSPAQPPVARPWGWMTATTALGLIVVIQWLSTPSSNQAKYEYTLATLQAQLQNAEAAATAARAESAKVRVDFETKLAQAREEIAQSKAQAQVQVDEARKQLALATKRAADAERQMAKEQAFYNGPGELVRLDRPDGEYAVPPLNEGAHLTLIGTVGTLRLHDINGAFVDASRLKARNIYLNDHINGRAMVKLHAPQGRVELSAVNAEAQVEIDAEGGRIETKDLNGEARLRLRGKEIRLYGNVNGTVQVRATLTKDGSMKFHRLQGESKVLWKKDQPTDPAPTITPGEIRGKAELSEEEE